MFTLTPKSFPQLLSGQIQIPQFCRVSAVPRHPALPCSSQICAVTFPFPFGLLPHAHCLEVGDSPSSLLLLSFKSSAWKHHFQCSSRAAHCHFSLPASKS